MRSLSANAAAAVAASVTLPRYLIELGFDPLLRYATIETVEWDGETWLANGAKVSGLQTSPDGTTTGKLILPNQDGAFGALLLANRARGRTCRIWMLYGEAPFAVEDAVQVFDGLMDAIPKFSTLIEVNLVSKGADGTLVPRLTMAKVFGTGLPVPGDRIVYLNTDITLTSQTPKG